MDGHREPAWELWAPIVTLAAIIASYIGAFGTSMSGGLFEGIERSSGARDLTWSVVAGAGVIWLAAEVAAKYRRAGAHYWFLFPLVLIALFAFASGSAFQWLLFDAPWHGEGVPGTVRAGAYGWYTIGAVALGTAITGVVVVTLRSRRARHRLRT